jgi:hypothetical protein
VDTKTSVLDTDIKAITTKINDQVDTKTSVLDTDIKAITTKLGDKSQSTQIVDGSGNVIGTTDVAGTKGLNAYILGGVTLEVKLEHANDSVAVWGNDGSNDKQLKTNSSGELSVNVASSALPSGAATDTKLDTLNTSIGTVGTNTGNTATNTSNTATNTSNTATNTSNMYTRQGDGNQKSQVVDGSNHSIGSSYINGNYPISLNVDDNPLGKTNIETDYTYYTVGPAAGKAETIIEYATGATSGAWGKKTTYTYDANAKVTKIKIENYQLP